MGRYDQNKSKRGGRYGLSSSKQSQGINGFVVIILVILAAAVGYFAKQIIDGELKFQELPFRVPFINNAEPIIENRPTDSILSKKFKPDADEEPVEDVVETLETPEEVVVLPELAASDSAIRDAIMDVSPELAFWLISDGLIKNYVTIVNDFSQGLRISKHFRFIKLNQPFVAEQIGTDVFLDKLSYQRYDRLAQAVDAIDAPRMVAVYKKFRPLLLQVYADFSYPEDHPLETIFTKAAEQILTAPIIEEPIPLLASSIRYKFKDPQLEALNSVHKQMLRMGPENTRLIQNKLRTLLEEMAYLKFE